MKHILTLGFLISFSYFSNGQNLLNEAKVWKIDRYEWVGDYHNLSSYKIIGDSLHADKNYKKLFEDEGNLGNFNKLVALLREESGIIYCIKDDDIEVALYDFNMVVGDNIEVNNDCTLALVEIDSVQYISPTKYKRFIFESPNLGDLSFDIVEEIGSFAELLHPYSPYCYTDANLTTYCVIDDGEIIYENPNLACDFEVVINEIGRSSTLIFPNPSIDGFFTIEKIDHLFTSAQLYDLNGKVISSYQVKDNNLSLQIENKGIFILHFISETGKSQRLKLIVN